LYIRDLVASSTRPVKELKGFEMVELQPNESKEISFTITEKTLEFFTANSKWETEPGDFKVFIGGSSLTALEGSFKFIN
jgi:beta-glucosidase